MATFASPISASDFGQFRQFAISPVLLAGQRVEHLAPELHDRSPANFNFRSTIEQGISAQLRKLCKRCTRLQMGPKNVSWSVYMCATPSRFRQIPNRRVWGTNWVDFFHFFCVGTFSDFLDFFLLIFFSVSLCSPNRRVCRTLGCESFIFLSEALKKFSEPKFFSLYSSVPWFSK